MPGWFGVPGCECCTPIPCGGCVEAAPDDMAIVVSGVAVGSSEACCTDYNDSFVLPQGGLFGPSVCYFENQMDCGTDICCLETYDYDPGFPAAIIPMEIDYSRWELYIYDDGIGTASARLFLVIRFVDTITGVQVALFTVRWDATGLDQDCTNWSSESFTFTSQTNTSPFYTFCNFSGSSVLVSAV